MANVPHSGLTGSDLHEPKGVAAAATGKVYVSNGSGSGAWTALSTYNPFANALLHVECQRVSGTADGGSVASTWTTRTINTAVTNEISGASLASNQITLPAGSYIAEISAPCYASGRHKVKLYNVTDASDTKLGTSAYVGGATEGQTDSLIFTKFTIAGSKVFEVRHNVEASRATNGFGLPSSLGTEVYTIVKIWKTA